MDQSSALFYIHILDGYSFRNTISIIKSETDYVTMWMSPYGVEISFRNNRGNAMHRIFLDQSEFKYEYNVFENDEYKEEFPISFETNEMFNTTKGIGRRDGIILYHLNNEDYINVQPLKNNGGGPSQFGALFVETIKNQPLEKVGLSTVFDKEPNVRVQAKSFAEICGQASTLKCTTLEIIGNAESVVFKIIKPDNNVASIMNFKSSAPRKKSGMRKKEFSSAYDIDNIINKCKSSEKKSSLTTSSVAPINSLNIVSADNINTIRVPISTVKALSKIHNISPQGTHLKLFFSKSENHEYTKIESPIGTYGKYEIFLRNVKN